VDGEWHITIEVFRDLGIAFAAVLVLIYVLVVGWFRSFIVPLVIMAPIPLTLVGIFRRTRFWAHSLRLLSMIGFIAGAGIIVRNSISWDFIELRRRQGMPLDQAVIDAGAVRFRPMLLTAAAVVVGASVILSDPIFKDSLVTDAEKCFDISPGLLSFSTLPTHGRLPLTHLNPTRNKELHMTVERAVRLMAGVMILLSLTLAHYSHFTGFADGIRRTEPAASAFTNWCPAMTIFRALGLKDAGCGAGE